MSSLKTYGVEANPLTIEEALAHYGVKGMKWGVRKDEHSSMTRSQKKQTKSDYKKDVKWEKTFFSSKLRMTMYNEIADQLNANIGRINAKYEGKDVSDWSKGVGLKYVNEYRDVATEAAEASRKRLIPDSPSGKYTTRVEYDPINELFPRVYLVEKDVKHADASDEPSIGELEIVFVWKDNRIVKVKPMDANDIEHVLSVAGVPFDSPAAELIHYGVKGMKWGIRRPVGSDGLVQKGGAAAKKVGEKIGSGAAKVGGAAKRINQDKRPLVKEAKEMDLNQLRETVKRLRLEKEYVELSVDQKIKSKTKLNQMFTESAKSAQRTSQVEMNKAADELIRKVMASAALA